MRATNTPGQPPTHNGLLGQGTFNACRCRVRPPVPTAAPACVTADTHQTRCARTCARLVRAFPPRNDTQSIPPPGRVGMARCRDRMTAMAPGPAGQWCCQIPARGAASTAWTIRRRALEPGNASAHSRCSSGNAWVLGGLTPTGFLPNVHPLPGTRVAQRTPRASPGVRI